jgi:hypothetical protein
MAGVKNKIEPRGRTKESIAPREQSKNICVMKSEAADGFLGVCWLALELVLYLRFILVRHVTGNDKDYLRKIPRVVW